MKKAIGSAALVLVAMAAANGAQAQGRGGRGGDEAAPGSPRRLIQERPPKPPTAESEDWLAREIQIGDWRVIAKDADGVILAHPAGTVRGDGVVPMHLRIEYRTPLTINRREIRSVQAELQVDCGTQQLLGQVSGFEGANLSGRRIGLEPIEVAQGGPGSAKVVAIIPQAEGLKLLSNPILREQCAEGHRALAGKFGPEWRPVLSDESGILLVGGNEAPRLDRKLDLTYRIEAANAQTDAKLKWRSAIAKMQVDCAEGKLLSDTTLYSGPNESGSTAPLSFEGYVTPAGLRSRIPGDTSPPAPRKPGEAGFGDTGPGKSVLTMLRNGALILGECESAKARLAAALSTPGDPVRRQAETWASQSLNTKGFRLPTYLPEGVLLLSDEVVATPTGQRRAVVRSEYSRPLPTRDGKPIASKITVIEVDCTAKKLRGLSESTFAKNGAKELIREAANPQAAWASVDELPSLGDYVGAVCSSKPTG
jgi:hypothetical protein